MQHDDAARKRATVETYARNEAALRRTAKRYSLCEDDADDALQRGLEILLKKAPSGDPRELIKWTQTVVKHEALAIRRDRERILPPSLGTAEGESWLDLLPATSDGPAERAERREAIARSREALRALKPQELRALTLLAEGYSYAEIGEITSWSRTKINRCLAEGRARFRSLVSSHEDGRRCAEMRPLISAFCDGEAGAEESERLREHLRACAPCRATVRAYRAAPGAAAALAPVLPIHRSLWERAYDALAGVTERFGGGRAESVTQLASGGGAGGAGVALAKIGVVCAVGASGGAACVAAGLVPTALDPGDTRARPVEAGSRGTTPARLAAMGPARTARSGDGPASKEPRPKRKFAAGAPASNTGPALEPAPAAQPAPAPAEPAPDYSEPATSGGAVEPAPPPPPDPAPEPVPAAAGGDGNPAGEFGP